LSSTQETLCMCTDPYLPDYFFYTLRPHWFLSY